MGLIAEDDADADGIGAGVLIVGRGRGSLELPELAIAAVTPPAITASAAPVAMSAPLVCIPTTL